jgi:tRNA(adenine34) deaminase
MIHARIKELVYGAPEPKTGAVGSAFELLDSPRHNHRILVRRGVLAEDCAGLLKGFFLTKRTMARNSAGTDLPE